MPDPDGLGPPVHAAGEGGRRGERFLAEHVQPGVKRGRAAGVWVLGVGSGPLGHLEMGLLDAALGAPGALLINGAIVVAAVGTLLLRAPGYRWAMRPTP